VSAPLHRWDLPPEEARLVQAGLKERLRLEWDGRPVRTVAGVDVSIGQDRARAAIVSLSYPDLAPLDASVADAPLVFPYIPGLLAFREGPAVLAAWEALRHKADLLMFDGQGIAHPRGIGIASQMGLWLDRPTIGVAKSRLYGRHDEPGPERGDWTPLLEPRAPGRVIGAVLRTRPRSNPLFISPGHLMDTPAALQFVMACLSGYRLPETTRWAHRVAGGEAIPKPGGDAEQARLF
jgi:deoxyribonuclease V